VGRWHDEGVPRDWRLERFPGKYVAIDVRTDEAVLVADTPQELHEEIQARGLRHVATMRAPRGDEPLFVGPG
jgi:hypothetical protein